MVRDLLKRFVLPNSQLPAVIAAEALLKEAENKMKEETIRLKSIYNKARYDLYSARKKEHEIKSPKNIILYLYRGSIGVVYNSRDINRLSGIPMRTIQHSIKTLKAQGLLVEVEHNRYKSA